MTPEEAANQLDRKLRPYKWYISTGVGETGRDDPALFVYVTTAKPRELSRLADGWMGYKVIVSSVGSVRPARASGPRFAFFSKGDASSA